MKPPVARLVFVLAAALALLFAAWWYGRSARVTGHRWERDIFLDERRHVEEWESCSWLQEGVTVLEREDVTTTRRVRDGETCMGAGRYRNCTPRWREVRETEHRCRYTGDVWKPGRHLVAQGTKAEEPAWPEMNLKEGDCLGCEREGRRYERYYVLLDRDGASTECMVARDRWDALQVGERVRLRTQPFSSLVDCSHLR